MAGALLAATMTQWIHPNSLANAVVIEHTWGNSEIHDIYKCAFHVRQLCRLRTAENQERLSVFRLPCELRLDALRQACSAYTCPAITLSRYKLEELEELSY